MDNKKLRILAVVVVVLFFIYAKNNGPNAPVVNTPMGEVTYSADGLYKNITPMKHDIYKQLTIDLAPVIILSLASRDQIWNWDAPLNTVLGQSLLAVLGYFIFYQVVQPYFVEVLPNM